MRDGEEDLDFRARDRSVEWAQDAPASGAGGRQGEVSGALTMRYRPDSAGVVLSRLEPVLGFDARSLSAVDLPGGGLGWEGYGHVDDGEDSVPYRADAPLDVYEGKGNVSVITTEGPPWSWICQLVVRRRRGDPELATGWLASPRVVVTAGRTVYHPELGWPESVEVYPGIDGSLTPWGKAAATGYSSVRGWTEDQDPESNYGCLFLGEELANAGHFGVAWDAGPSLVGQILNTCGYPADRPRGTQWFDAGRVVRARRRSVEFGPGLATTGGGPLWLNCRVSGRTQRLVCAIALPGEGRMRHLLIDRSMAATLEGWIARAQARAEPAVQPAVI